MRTTRGGVISIPGRGWQPCVAPYFADRGVGDMRGPPDGIPKSHPGGGGRPSSHRTTVRYTIDTQNDTRQTIVAAQPRTTSGVRFGWSDLARPACRQPPPGLEKCTPLVFVSLRRMLRCARIWAVWVLYLSLIHISEPTRPY